MSEEFQPSQGTTLAVRVTEYMDWCRRQAAYGFAAASQPHENATEVQIAVSLAKAEVYDRVAETLKRLL